MQHSVSVRPNHVELNFSSGSVADFGAIDERLLSSSLSSICRKHFGVDHPHRRNFNGAFPN